MPEGREQVFHDFEDRGLRILHVPGHVESPHEITGLRIVGSFGDNDALGVPERLRHDDDLAFGSWTWTKAPAGNDTASMSGAVPLDAPVTSGDPSRKELRAAGNCKQGFLGIVCPFPK